MIELDLSAIRFVSGGVCVCTCKSQNPQNATLTLETAGLEIDEVHCTNTCMSLGKEYHSCVRACSRYQAFEEPCGKPAALGKYLCADHLASDLTNGAWH